MAIYESSTARNVRSGRDSSAPLEALRILSQNVRDISHAVTDLRQWPEDRTEYRQLRASALLWERRLVEFLLPGNGPPGDALSPEDFGVQLDLTSQQDKALRDRKRKLNNNMAHLNWEEITYPRKWRIARIGITLEVLRDFAEALPDRFAT